VLAGRQAYLAGRMPRKLYATASSPLEGVVRWLKMRRSRFQSSSVTTAGGQIP